MCLHGNSISVGGSENKHEELNCQIQSRGGNCHGEKQARKQSVRGLRSELRRVGRLAERAGGEDRLRRRGWWPRERSAWRDWPVQSPRAPSVLGTEASVSAGASAKERGIALEVREETRRREKGLCEAL